MRAPSQLLPRTQDVMVGDVPIWTDSCVFLENWASAGASGQRGPSTNEKTGWRLI